jgi:uncharacterized protein (TIRG00374 family)
LAVSEPPVREPPVPSGAGASKRQWWWRRWWRAIPVPLRHLARLGIVLLIVEYLLLPQIAGTRKAIHLLSDVNVTWLVLGVFLEVAALVAYAQLTRSVLPKRSDPGLGTVLRIQLSTLSVSHCVPGGTAAGSTLGYRLLTTAGVGRAEAGFALATQALGSAVVLNVIFWLALVVSIPVWGFSPLYVTAAAAGVVVMGAFMTLLLLFTRGEERAARIIARAAARMPWVDEVHLERSFRQMSARVRELAREPRTLVRATMWATANWLLDAASLYVFVGAFGHWVNPDGLLVAYGLANVLAALPITPGGLGVVETILTSALVGFNTTRGVAILGVLAYRLVNFWLPIPVGGLCYLSLQVRPGVAGAEARRKLAQQRRKALHQFMEVVAPRGAEKARAAHDGVPVGDEGPTNLAEQSPEREAGETGLVVVDNHAAVETPTAVPRGGSAA